jgi:hypothetical protein
MQLAALARQNPVLMIFEDLHWIDPTRAFSGKLESGGIPKEARIGFKIPTGARGPVMNGEAILR